MCVFVLTIPQLRDAEMCTILFPLCQTTAARYFSYVSENEPEETTKTLQSGQQIIKEKNHKTKAKKKKKTSNNERTKNEKERAKELKIKNKIKNKKSK